MTGKPLFLTVVFSSCFLLLIACGEQQALSDIAFEEVDGIVLVKNPAEPLNPELQITFEEELSIGVVNGDEDYMFGNRILVNTDEQGIFYVSDVDHQVVKTYDSNGRFLRSLGGPGQGPGEFQTISVVRFDGGGNIYLWDGVSQRLSFLKKNGEFLRGFRPRLYTEEVLITKSGYYIAKSADNVELKGSKEWDYFYGLFDSEFKLRSEFFRQHQESDTGKNGGSPAQVLATWLSSLAFQPRVSYALDKNDFLYFGYSGEYKVEVFSPEGTLIRRIQRDYEPLPISGRDKDDFRKTHIERLQNKMPASEENAVFKLVEYPEYKPAFVRFTLMENGWIFVVVESKGSSRALVDIFDQEGVYLGQFETDVQTDRLFFNNGKAYTIAMRDDYEYVKRYRFKIAGAVSVG